MDPSVNTSELPGVIAAQLGLPDRTYDLYLALTTIIRNSLLGGEGVSLTRVGNKLEISLSGSLVAGSGLQLVQEGNTLTISLIDDLVNSGTGITVTENNGRYEVDFNGIEGSDTIDVNGTDPYTLSIAPGAIQGSGSVTVTRDPATGIFTVGLEGLQYWEENYDATQGVTSWDAVNSSVAALRNVNGFTLNKGLLSNPAAIALGLDSVDLHQSTGSTATGTNSGILSGENNTAGGIRSAVLAGESNTAGGTNATVGGGDSNGAFGVNSFTGGGQNNQATGLSSSVVGGVANNSTGTYNAIGGGAENSTSAESSGVLCGRLNIADGLNSGVVTGRNNRAHGLGSAVLTGDTNFIAVEIAYYSAIVAGQVNIIYESTSAILCGVGNTVNAIRSSVLSGLEVTIDTPDTHNLRRGRVCDSSAGGKNVKVYSSQSLAMGHELVSGSLTQPTHATLTSGSHLNNSQSNSSMLGRHGVSTTSSPSLSFCSGTLTDPRVAVLLTEEKGVGLARLDSLQVTGTNVSYLFPKDDSFPAIVEGEEDVGHFVSLTSEGKVSLHLSNVVGVTVPRTGIILNSQDAHWHGKYLRTEMGSLITRPSYIDSFLEFFVHLPYGDGTALKEEKRLRDEILESLPFHDDPDLLDWVKSTYSETWEELSSLNVTLVPRQVPVLNPAYDSSRSYISRLARVNEWVPVCHKGVVRVRADASCIVGSYCSPKKMKECVLASKSKDGYLVVDRVSPSVVSILL